MLKDTRNKQNFIAGYHRRYPGAILIAYVHKSLI